MKIKPPISVVMSVKNGERYLPHSIKSILLQSFKTFECIIVNDCSSDKTAEVLKKIKDERVKVITNSKSLGLTRSLRKAVKIAKGKYIARMDSDDISRSNRLYKQFNFLENNQEIGVLGSWVRIINDEGKIVKIKKFPTSSEDIQKSIIYTNPIRHSTVMFRKSLIDKYGSYDSQLDGAEDYDLWLRYSKFTKLANLEELLLDYRIHRESVSQGEEIKVLKSAVKARIKALKKYKYDKVIIIPIIYSSVALLIPTYVKKSFIGFYDMLIKIKYIMIKNFLLLVKKTDKLSSLSLRLVKITHKYPSAVHPKHLININNRWFIKYINSKDIILDIGCNNGKNTILAAKYCRKIIGLDIDRNALILAKDEIYRKKIKNVGIKEWNVEKKLPFKKSSFNKVFLFAVLEHIINRKQLIDEIYRILKPNGYLLLSVPNIDTSWKRLQKKYSINPFSDDDHKLEYNRLSINKFIRSNKFKVLEVNSVSYDMPFVGIIDLIGGISLSVYRYLSLLRKWLVKFFPGETMSYEIIAKK